MVPKILSLRPLYCVIVVEMASLLQTQLYITLLYDEYGINIQQKSAIKAFAVYTTDILSRSECNHYKSVLL